MFTTLDKALIALVMGAISVANLLFNTSINVDQTLVSGIIAAITPVLVYLIPNKK